MADIKMSVKVSPETHVKIRKLAADNDKSTSKYIARLIEAHLTRKGAQP